MSLSRSFPVAQRMTAPPAGDDGGVGLDDGASRGDGDEAGEDAVAHRDEVPDLVQRVVQEHRGDAAGGGGERGDDGDAGGDFSRGAVGDGQLRAGVEAVPADPEDEGAEHNERGVVPGMGTALPSGPKRPVRGPTRMAPIKGGPRRRSCARRRSPRVNHRLLVLVGIARRTTSPHCPTPSARRRGRRTR